MAPIIAIIGATGQTGRSIVDGLLSAETSPPIPPASIISLTRPTSVSNAANAALSSLGLTIRSFSLASPHEDLVSSLKGVDILISCMSGADDQLLQIQLADAAKEAGVGRFIPSAWLPIIPPGGVHIFRDMKEQVYAHVESIDLPFTIVDVGWWYQVAFPALPSGKIDYALGLPVEEIYGTGEQKSALTDLRDVGRYVARIIQDDRTVNKYVFCYNELHSQLDWWAILEKLSSETIPRNFISQEEVEAEIAEALPKIQGGMDLRSGEGLVTAFKVVARQYVRSWGIRGDNTPEKAEQLGYVISKELWPEMEFVKYEDFLRDVVKGEAKPVYDEETRAGYRQAWEGIKAQKKQQQQQQK
ncbi:hypothetical protein Q7P35_009768 [Cladosporium inversicolor]